MPPRMGQTKTLRYETSPTTANRANSLMKQRWLEGYRNAAVFGGIARILSIGIRLISVPLCITLLSPERYGLWLILSSLVGWLGFSDLGVPAAVQNRLIALKRQGRRADSYNLVGYASRLLLTIGAILTVASLICIPNIPWQSLFNFPTSQKPEFVLALLLSSAAISIGLPSRLGNVIYNSEGLLAVPPLSIVISQICGFAMLSIAVFFEWDNLVVLSICSLVGVALGPALLTVLAIHSYRYSIRSPAPRKTDRIAVLSKGTFFFLSTLGEIAIFQTDAIVIGVVRGAGAVVAYMIPNALLMNYLNAQNVFLHPLWPLLTDAYAAKDGATVSKILKRGFLTTTFTAAAFSAGIFAIGDTFIRWWSRGAASLPPLMAIGFASYICVASIDNLLATCLNAFNHAETRLACAFLLGIAKLGTAILCLQAYSVFVLPLAFSACVLLTSLPIAAFQVARTLRSIADTEASTPTA